MNNFYNNPLNQNFVSSIFGQCSHLITPGTFARNSSKLTAKEYEKKVYVLLLRLLQAMGKLIESLQKDTKTTD